MDKRKIKITKSSDGRTTITRNKFGSGYKKESILLRTSTVVDSSTDMDKVIKSLNDGYDPIQLIDGIEKRIFQFLKDNNLPTEGTKKTIIAALPFHLIKNYSHVLGAFQAGKCLEEILCCRQTINNKDYKMATAHALRLVDEFSKFIFSTLEPTLALGNSHQGGMIGNNIKLSNDQYDQYDQCFKWFESLDIKNDGTRKLKIGEKWEITKQFALEQLHVNISTQSLTKAYRNK